MAMEKQIYFGIFNSKDDVCSEFNIVLDEKIIILYAEYKICDYDGDAFVLFQKNGKLYEVNASHCSCSGIEGEWEPEQTSKEALKHYLKEGERFNSLDGLPFLEKLIYWQL